jgi:hypothetical protein
MIDTTSGAFARMTRAGFIFEIQPVNHGGQIQGTMTCVCGRVERWAYGEAKITNGKVDIASIAERIGAASAKHLKRDGYTLEQIKSIRQAFL